MEQVKRKKSAKRERKIRLTSRDRDLLKYIERYQFATAEEIKVQFWGAAITHNHYRRLRFLAGHGLLRLLKNTGEQTNVYGLGYRSNPHLATLGLGLEPSAFPRAFYTSSFQHDRQMRCIQKIFESSKIITDFRPEHVVRQDLAEKFEGLKKPGGYKVPDAVFTLQRPNAKALIAALELELTYKSRKRYLHSFRRMIESSASRTVFYIFSTSRQISRFEALFLDLAEKDSFVRAWRSRYQFYFVTLDEILSKGNAALWRGEGGSFSLSGLERTDGAGELACTSIKKEDEHRDEHRGFT